jgi:phage-related protein
MLNLPAGLISAKNAWDEDNVALVVVKIEMPSVLVEPIRIVNNDVDVNWEDPDTSTSEDWISFPFEIDNIGEPSKGELQSVALRVSNVGRAIQGYVDQADGGVDAEVTIHVINGTDLAQTGTYVTLAFTVGSSLCDENWVTFTLTSIDPFRRKFPKNRCLKNYCNFQFKSVFCGYSGGATECDHSLTRCKELGNSSRFGGFPAIGTDGLKVTSANMFTS